MTYLFPSRGCVYEAQSEGRASGAGFKLEPDLRGDANTPILIQGIELSDSDVLSAKMAIGGAKTISIFGPNFGALAVQCVALMGEVGSSSSGKNLQTVVEYMAANRLSKKEAPVVLSGPGSTRFELYLSRLNIGRTDANFNAQYFTISGIIAPPPK